MAWVLVSRILLPTTFTDDSVISSLPLLFEVAMAVPYQRNSRVASLRGPSVTFQVPMSSCGIEGATYLKMTKLMTAEPTRQSSKKSHSRELRAPERDVPPASSVGAFCALPSPW